MPNRCIREVYRGLGEPKADYSVSPQTIIEQVDAIVDAVMGPSPYRGVTMLNNASDYLSEQGFAITITDPHRAYSLLQASAELGRLADELDAELAEKFAAEFGGSHA